MTRLGTHPGPLAALGLALAGTILLGGCTGQSPDEPSPAPSGQAAQRSDIVRLGDCLEAAGFDVTVDERQSAIDHVGAAGDTQAYDGAYQACRKQTGF